MGVIGADRQDGAYTHRPKSVRIQMIGPDVAQRIADHRAAIQERAERAETARRAELLGLLRQVAGIAQ